MKIEDRILEFLPNRREVIWGSEDWLVSIHKNSPCRVAKGIYKGRSLAEIAPDLHILVKTINAKTRLSVQVHPNEKTQKFFGGEAKTEMWCALNDGFVWAGLKSRVKRIEVEEAARNGTIEHLLVKRELKRGDAIFIPGGMVHAIGDNTFIYEVQQSADTTFRFYDWGRLGTDGKPRELHLAQALYSIDYDIEEPEIFHDISCKYFDFKRIKIDPKQRICGKGYTILYAFSGSFYLAGVEYPQGSSLMVLDGDDFELDGDGAEVLVTKSDCKLER
ncbi:MAG: class I mannose-6-phosphate isomerase [Kiritimatiellae bacterium]|nr:class I mannose-6-phosphate isomerase [Kiritimatiellia bacterium]